MMFGAPVGQVLDGGRAGFLAAVLPSAREGGHAILTPLGGS